MLISPGYMGMKTGSDCAGEEISVCAFRSGLRPAECACTPSFDPVIIVRYNSIRNLILPPVEGPFCFRPPPQQDGLFSLFVLCSDTCCRCSSVVQCGCRSACLAPVFSLNAL